MAIWNEKTKTNAFKRKKKFTLARYKIKKIKQLRVVIHALFGG